MQQIKHCDNSKYFRSVHGTQFLDFVFVFGRSPSKAEVARTLPVAGAFQPHAQVAALAKKERAAVRVSPLFSFIQEKRRKTDSPEENKMKKRREDDLEGGWSEPVRNPGCT